MSSNKHPHVESTRFESGSGNVFADLGLPDPGEALVKAGLAREIAEAVEGRGLSQDEAADMIGLDQREVSAILRGRLSGFPSDRLTRCLLALRAPLGREKIPRDGDSTNGDEHPRVDFSVGATAGSDGRFGAAPPSK